jgi:hypothetical protein
MIKAVFVQAGSEATELSYGLKVHSMLLAHFRLSEANVPLLEYDANSASEPFRLLNISRKPSLPPLTQEGGATHSRAP